MTSTVATTVPAVLRCSRTRRYLMCPPTYFAVRYTINPWMDPAVPVQSALAVRQWETLVEAYRTFGHEVELLTPEPGLPDMVFAANGATVVDGRVLPARFAYPQRSAEAGAHVAWYAGRGNEVASASGGVSSFHVATPHAMNEGEGDFAVLSDCILAGYGFRTELAAHGELAELTGRDVISLELVDPRFYHLDVALMVLDDASGQVAYLPEAFSPASRRRLQQLYPDALIATVSDAEAFGLNGVSDGRHVFLPAAASRLGAALADAGYEVVPVDVSELIKGGGAVKCCTQEIRFRITVADDIKENAP